MEDDGKFFQNKKEKKKKNFPKSNPDLQTLLTGKDNNEEIPQKLFPSLVKKRRKNKFNSIDNMPLHYKSNKINNIKKDNINFSPRNTKRIPLRNGNYNTESFVDKLYEDEPHLKKSVFKKKPTKLNLKNFNRKVSFLSPKHKNKNIINLIKVDQNLNIDKNDSKSKLIKDDPAEEQLYGFDKKYNITVLRNSKNEEIAKTSILDKDAFFGRSLKRKQTCKTSKSNISKRTEKRSANNPNHNFKRNAKKKMTSKSIEKKYKKKSSKIIKENNKEKNNNINNKDDKLKLDKNKAKKGVIINDKNIKKGDNEEEKNNKNQELSQKKPIDNVETLVQIENKDKKKRKKNSWCNPFFLCLNMNNNEENDIN